jgi:predicted enzyme related to lactoylglutathione lyase
MSRDPEASERFYREVAGLSVRSMPGVGRAKEIGGQVLLPPTDVAGVSRAAEVPDPDGAAFGLFEARRGEG